MKGLARIENRIKRKREELGYRQCDLAFLLKHKSASQVSRYERGLVFPDAENLLKLCYSLGTVPEWLYPEITRRWREEVRKAREQLTGEKQHEENQG